MSNLFLATVVVAQLITTPLDAKAQQAPDLVVLHDGSRYRGTLAESVPDSHHTMMLITGDVRRFEARDVAYAGPADAAPSAAVATPEATTETMEPSSEVSGPAGITVQVRSTPESYRVTLTPRSAEGPAHHCPAPCRLTVPPGSYEIRAATLPQTETEQHRLLPLLERLELSQPVELHVLHSDHGGGRAAGGALIAFGFLGGAAAALTIGFGVQDGDDGLVTAGGVAAGISLSLLIAGLITVAASQPAARVDIELLGEPDSR